MVHPVTGGRADVPERTVERHLARGWVLVDELPPPPITDETTALDPPTGADPDPEATASTEQEL